MGCCRPVFCPRPFFIPAPPPPLFCPPPQPIIINNTCPPCPPPVNRTFNDNRRYDNRRYDNRRHDNRRYDNRRYDNRRYDNRTFIDNRTSNDNRITVDVFDVDINISNSEENFLRQQARIRKMAEKSRREKEKRRKEKERERRHREKEKIQEREKHRANRKMKEYYNKLNAQAKLRQLKSDNQRQTDKLKYKNVLDGLRKDKEMMKQDKDHAVEMALKERDILAAKMQILSLFIPQLAAHMPPGMGNQTAISGIQGIPGQAQIRGSRSSSMSSGGVSAPGPQIPGGTGASKDTPAKKTNKKHLKPGARKNKKGGKKQKKKGGKKK